MTTGGQLTVLAFQSLGSILMGYGLVFGLTGLYAAPPDPQGRARWPRQVPDEDKPWI